MEAENQDFDFNFNRLFAESKGQPVIYNGDVIYLADKLSATLGEVFIVTIESTHSKYLQGVGVSENVRVFGQQEKRAVVFEHYSVPIENRSTERSRLPFQFEVECRNKKGFLWFYNMCLVNDRQEWWHGGCAMRREAMESGFRYFCNDWQRNDDFTDIVFSVRSIGRRSSR